MLTEGAAHEKYDKRAMARKHHFARGRQKQLEGDETAIFEYAFRLGAGLAMEVQVDTQE